MGRGIAWTCWNLFLALLPVLLGRSLARTAAGRLHAGTALLLAGWLLLLPNTAYLMTEWRHFLFDDHFVLLRERGQADRAAMFETAVWGLLFAGYAATGALLFTLAVRPVERLARGRGHAVLRWAPILLLLVALGVYIGLFERVNSWDALANPGAVLEGALRALRHPTAALAIVGFAVILGVIYLVVGWVLDGLAADLARVRARRRSTSTTAASTNQDARDGQAKRA